MSKPLSLSWVLELAYEERLWNTEEVVYVCDKDTARTSPATYSGYDASLVNTDRLATEREGSVESNLHEASVSDENAAPSAVRKSQSAKKRRWKKGSFPPD